LRLRKPAQLNNFRNLENHLPAKTFPYQYPEGQVCRRYQAPHDPAASYLIKHYLRSAKYHPPTQWQLCAVQRADGDVRGTATLQQALPHLA